MAHNVPGCKRRFASPYKQTVRFAGLANCGGVRRGNGAKRNDLAERSPSREWRRSVYNPVICSGGVCHLFFIHEFLFISHA